ncbi:MAG: hypothetical protein K2Y22_10395 [Candidatus Obscuribacterales bacterium]|nr:hypothetical protein [Candidatus Obscuribacterales bacterium]
MQNASMHKMETRYIDEQELSRITGWSRAKIQRDRVVGGGIPFIKGEGLRAAVRYDLIEVHHWMESHKRTSTSDSGQEG